jgi:Ca2+-binding RTX toxin-like protein
LLVIVKASAKISVLTAMPAVGWFTYASSADIYKYNAIADSTQTNADTITDFNVTADKLDLIDIITTATNGAITDVASLAKYFHAEIDTSVAHQKCYR